MLEPCEKRGVSGLTVRLLEMSMSDRELLEFAAKAAGMPGPVDDNGVWSAWVGSPENGHWWNPLQDDGDALRLAVALKVQVIIHSDWVEGLIDGIQLSSPQNCYSADCCMFETARRAIVKAVAQIGKAMQEQPK